MSNIIIIGAGGQAQAVLEALESDENNKIVGYLDANKDLRGKEISGYKVLGDLSLLKSLVADKIVDSAIVAIGESKVRRKYAKLIKEANVEAINAIHPRSTISKKAKLGKGIFIGAGVVIGPYSVIGDYSIININSVIPHYNSIGDYVNIAPGVNMGGGCKIGECSFVGIGSTIKQYTNVGANSIIGAGAVVIRDVGENVVYAGIPAKFIKDNPTE